MLGSIALRREKSALLLVLLRPRSTELKRYISSQRQEDQAESCQSFCVTLIQSSREQLQRYIVASPAKCFVSLSSTHQDIHPTGGHLKTRFSFHLRHPSHLDPALIPQSPTSLALTEPHSSHIQKVPQNDPTQAQEHKSPKLQATFPLVAVTHPLPSTFFLVPPPATRNKHPHSNHFSAQQASVPVNFNPLIGCNCMHPSDKCSFSNVVSRDRRQAKQLFQLPSRAASPCTCSYLQQDAMPVGQCENAACLSFMNQALESNRQLFYIQIRTST